MTHPASLFTAALLILSGVPSTTARGQSTDVAAQPATSQPIDRQITQLADQGIEFLRTRGQAADGSFSGETGVAVTALVTRAILEHRPAAAKNDPVIANALKYILDHVQSDGGIYKPGSMHKNYETSAAVMALSAANDNQQYDSQLRRAEAYLKDIQWDDKEGVGPDDPAYGGAGYGSSSRPDLSNTSFLIEALRELGNDADDESIQKALVFVSRTQNLSGQGNDTPNADKIGDGGFYYTPAAGGQTKAEPTANGGLRSYGSMTYAGLRSMIYAGVTKDDPRVVAALRFIQQNYSLETNPNMGAQGLYYYYHTFAKALDAAEIEVVDDAAGTPHPWRRELVDQLARTQQSDGSWVNTGSDRWMEGDRQLVTAYSLLALARAKQP